MLAQPVLLVDAGVPGQQDELGLADQILLRHEADAGLVADRLRRGRLFQPQPPSFGSSGDRPGSKRLSSELSRLSPIMK